MSRWWDRGHWALPVVTVLQCTAPSSPPNKRMKKNEIMGVGGLKEEKKQNSSVNRREVQDKHKHHQLVYLPALDFHFLLTLLLFFNAVKKLPLSFSAPTKTQTGWPFIICAAVLWSCCECCPVFSELGPGCRTTRPAWRWRSRQSKAVEDLQAIMARAGELSGTPLTGEKDPFLHLNWAQVMPASRRSHGLFTGFTSC